MLLRAASPRLRNPARLAPLRRAPLRVAAAASKTPAPPPPAPLSGGDTALLAVGAISVPVVAFSLYVLQTTGCGLPPGPGGLYGAVEGVSYLGLAGFLFASVQRKVATGTGLPPGPGGALGAVEGLAYLVVLAGLGVGAAQFAQYGGLPTAVPAEGSRCFVPE